MSFTKTGLVGKYAEMLDKAFGIENSLYEFNPGKLLLPSHFEDIADDVKKAKVKEDDVWLISFPRTGSTWVQEIIWLIGNNLNFVEAEKTIQQLRAPMIELSTYIAEYTDFLKDYGNSVDLVENWPSPRYIKSHLTVEFLPENLFKINPKIIYVARHPKDLCVSYYHYCKLLYNMDLPFEDFAELFINDSLPFGSVFQHYLSFWNKRNEANVLFLKYEDLKRDTKSGIKLIADFIEKPINEKQIDQLEEFVSVEKMKKNRGCNMAPIINSLRGNNYFEKSGKCFIRKGQIGDWKNYMDKNLSARFDEWIAKNTEGTGLEFN